MNNNWKEILENNKETIKILLNDFEKYYTLYNMHPSVLEYERNLTNVKGQIQLLGKSNDGIMEQISLLIAQIKENISKMDENKKKMIPLIKDNASTIFKNDTNKEYNYAIIKNVEIGFSIIILLFMFYKGTR